MLCIKGVIKNSYSPDSCQQNLQCEQEFGLVCRFRNVAHGRLNRVGLIMVFKQESSLI